MSIPLLAYSPSSQNTVVVGFEVSGEETPRIYTTENLLQPSKMDELIWAAYYQIFHEQQMLQSNRQITLESQLRNGQITVRDFIRGLATSDSFRRLNYDSNNNYRFVEICIQRILGRQVYNEREKLAWSIVIATKGLQGFIDDLLNSAEYTENFSTHTVPYQRRRVLPQRIKGDLPFQRMARYGVKYRDTLPLYGRIHNPSSSRERLTLKSFFNSSDRDVVLWISASLATLIAAYFLLPAFGLLPPFFGGY